MFTLILGFIVHLIFLLSVFDVYFKSPILNDLPVIENTVEPRAKRLVLIVGDGLRADSLYGSNINGTPSAPYLRSLLKTQASWGVSHTRVPTESRPGHIAMIAGFYEDPSAIFKGWQDNLFEFDSLFNRSSLTLGWGSPDIVPMFNKGNVAKHMILKSYPAEDQLFFGNNESSYGLNSWVFNAVNETLNNAEFESSGEGLKQDLHKNGVILFLHLLATDVSGHSDKPKSGEFFNVLRKTDVAIKSIVERVESFYKNDGKTLFVFTSDHGMTDWGSHGDGSDDETETPFIIWGPGVRKPEVLKTKREDDSWGLSHLARHDLRQADVVPLLALLTGVSIPVHSIGVLPVDFLDVTEGEKATMLQLNMKQINVQYMKRHDDIKEKSISLVYCPFKKLTKQLDLEMKNSIEKFIKSGQYLDAMPFWNGDSYSFAICVEQILFLELQNDMMRPLVEVRKILSPVKENFSAYMQISICQELISLSLEAINYYQNYYQFLLLGCVSISYFGWIFVLLTSLTKNYRLKNWHSKSSNSTIFSSLVKLSLVDAIFIFLSISVISFVNVQSLSMQFYIYGLLPVFLWWLAFKNNAALLFKLFFKSYHEYWFQLIGYVIGIELFVLTFFHRWAISVVLLALLCWPLSNYKNLIQRKCTILLYLWIISSVSLSVFPFLPASGLEPNVYYVMTSGFLWLLFISCILLIPSFKQFFILESKDISNEYFSLNVLRHILALLVTFYVCYTVSVSYSAKEGLLKQHQVLSWMLLGNSIVVPVSFIENDVTYRLVVLFLSMASPSLLLSIGHESIFYFLFSVHLLVWFALEYQLANQVSRGFIGGAAANLSLVTWRRGFYFLTFLLMSFFGAGNIASVSSFDVLTVHRFVTVFSPFIMMSLILVKLLIPFLLVVATVLCLYFRSHDSVNQLLLVVFIFCDLLGLHFLFLVKNVGSWKEIGMSLSHYVIVESIILFVFLILGLAHFYLKKFESTNFVIFIFQCFSPKSFAMSKKNH